MSDWYEVNEYEDVGVANDNIVDTSTPKLGDTLLNLLNLGIQYGSQQINTTKNNQPIKSNVSSASTTKPEKKKSILVPIIIGSGVLVLGATIFYFARKK